MTQDSDALYLNMPYGYQSEQILGKKTHPLTKEEKKELRKATKERRKLKWGRKLLRVFLKGDKQNISIKDKIASGKRNLVHNLVGKTVQSKDLNALFWTYASIDQDVFVPPHVKYFASKKDVQVGIAPSREISLSDYLAVLSYIRLSLVNFVQGISLLKTHAENQLAPGIKNNFNSPSTSYDTEHYYDEFKKILFPLYEEMYPEKNLKDCGKTLYFEGKIFPTHVVNYLAKISHYPQKESLLEDTFSNIDRSQELVVNGVYITLDDLITIVCSLHISLHVFSPEYKK